MFTKVIKIGIMFTKVIKIRIFIKEWNKEKNTYINNVICVFFFNKK